MSGPEYGPGGYLPPRAAKRARKIVLREQMGWGWPLAAIAAAVVVAVAGGAYLYSSSRAPSAPYVAVQPLNEIPVGGAATLLADRREVLVVRAGGPVRAYLPEPDEVRWCEQSRRLEAGDAAWTVDGRLVYGERRSLQPLRSVVHDGIVYVDFSTQLPRPAPGAQGEPPACGKS